MIRTFDTHEQTQYIESRHCIIFRLDVYEPAANTGKKGGIHRVVETQTPTNNKFMRPDNVPVI